MSDPLEQGDRLGDFEIVAVAGIGGMGVVYKARQVSLDRDVALKVIRDELANEPEYRQRFMREAKLAAAVDHPHVVTVYEVGHEEGRLFLAMQWIDGTDLKTQLGDVGRLPPETAVAIATQVAGALDALHETGLIHRDVKPANVLLREIGGNFHAYLTDFGVAKPPEATENLTVTGSTVGTTGYLAPEQIQGKDAGPRSDLYALGCLSFEMLTGSKPFTGENELAVRWAHANDPRPRVSSALPALGDRYDDFFATALAVDPGERFDGGRAFAEALTAARSGDGATGATAVEVKPREETKIGPPTPLPLGRPGEGAGATPGAPYGYVTPPPPPRERSGSPLALILLAIVALVGIGVGVAAAAGVFSDEAEAPASQSVAKASKGSASTKNQGGGKPKLPADASPCENGLWVNSVTSCPFAMNTRSAYAEANGAKKISVYSPVTGKTYAMSCGGAGTTVCRGGDNAAVYFTSAAASGQDTSSPAPAQAPAPSTSSSGSQQCDQNISTNSVTSCPFAQNVFVAYWEAYESVGEQPETYVEAFSPTTGETYGMGCSLSSDVVTCSGGNEAYVTFPMQAVRVY